MDLKILLASFGLVFLAELGDKTQLTAMALTSSSKAGWMDFAGTSLALITTTALAVLFGTALTQWLPQNVLHIVSAVAFIIIGVILLVNVARKAPAPRLEAPAGRGKAETAAGPRERPFEGIVFNWVASQAEVFEEDVIRHLQELLPLVKHTDQQEQIRQIVAEDRRHIESLGGLRNFHEPGIESEEPVVSSPVSEHLMSKPSDTALPVGNEDLTPQNIEKRIAEAVAAEEKLADFYLSLARKTKIHAARDAFRWLAMEDIDHAQRLCSLINPGEAAG